MVELVIDLLREGEGGGGGRSLELSGGSLEIGADPDAPALAFSAHSLSFSIFSSSMTLLSRGGIISADVEDPSIGSLINPRNGLSALGSKSSGMSPSWDWGTGELGASEEVRFFGPSSSVGLAVLLRINLLFVGT